MNSILLRCGYCGTPIGNDNQPLEGNKRYKAIRIIETYGDIHTQKRHGKCCVKKEYV